MIIDLIKDEESGVSKKVLELKGQDIYESLLGDDSKIEEFGKEILGNIEVYNMRAMRVGAYDENKLSGYFKEAGIVVIDPLSIITNERLTDNSSTNLMLKIWNKCDENNALCLIVDRTEAINEKDSNLLRALSKYILKIEQSEEGKKLVVPEKYPPKDTDKRKIPLLMRDYPLRQ